MTISAGILTEKIIFCAPDGEEIKTAHANIIPITAREQLRNGAEIIQDSYSLKMRYTKGISPSGLIRWRGYIYEILSMNADKQRDEIYLTIVYSAKNDENFRRS